MWISKSWLNKGVDKSELYFFFFLSCFVAALVMLLPVSSIVVWVIFSDLPDCFQPD